MASVNIVLLHIYSSGCLWILKEFPFWIPPVKAPLFNAGVFFILGGFIYYHKLAPRIEELQTWRFLKSRFRKLYPLHLVSLVLMAIVFWVRNHHHGNVAWFWESVGMHLSMTWAFVSSRFLDMNGPSWALTPFFLAYMTIKPFTRVLRDEKRSWILWLALIMTLIPGTVAAWCYSQVHFVKGAYMSFHTQPFIRVMEFYFGMVLGRLFQQQENSNRWPGWSRDLILVLTVALMWSSLKFMGGYGVFINYWSHHIARLLFYGVMIWQLATGKGWIATIMSLKPIRIVGQSSFYPYLLHLPLFAYSGMAARHFWHTSLFTQWWQVLLFFVCLYGASVLYQTRK